MAFGGTALLEAASAIKGKNLQQFAFEELDVLSGGSGQFFNGSFLAPATDDNVTSLEIGTVHINCEAANSVAIQSDLKPQISRSFRHGRRPRT